MTDQPDRRTILKAAAASAALLAPAAAIAQGSRDTDRAAIAAAVNAGFEESVRRIQQWIALPHHRRRAAQHHRRRRLYGAARDRGWLHWRPQGADRRRPRRLRRARRRRGAHRRYLFMYDVKQFDPSEWASPPLEGRIFDHPLGARHPRGRGAVNQKGPEGCFLAALHAFKAANKRLPVNLVLLAEGEEEIGSPHFHNVFQDARRARRVAPGERGDHPLGRAERRRLGPDHSGRQGDHRMRIGRDRRCAGGGAQRTMSIRASRAQVDSPVWHLVEALQTLVGDHGNRPAIDGWFEHVRPLTTRERALIAESARTRSEDEVKRSLGVTHWIDDLPWRESLERLTSQPTVNIEGLVAGYTGPGGKTILPSRGVAKLDLRLVPNMTVADALPKLRAHLASRGFGRTSRSICRAATIPPKTAENAPVIRAQQAVFTSARTFPSRSTRAAPAHGPAMSSPASRCGSAPASSAWASAAAPTRRTSSSSSKAAAGRGPARGRDGLCRLPLRNGGGVGHSGRKSGTDR